MNLQALNSGLKKIALFKREVILLIYILSILPTLAQDRRQENKSNINVTRQGFGAHGFLDMGLGFVNKKSETEGSAYYFDDWDTQALIYTKDKKKLKIKNVNINLYDNTLDALYDKNSIFTFNTKDLVKIVVKGKDFRVVEVDNKLKILESFFRGKFSIYKYQSVMYRDSSPNPMINRKTNKYIRKSKYYVYQNGKLVRLKLSKKSFSKHFQSNKISQESIIKFIKNNKLSLNKETDLIKVFTFLDKSMGQAN